MINTGKMWANSENMQWLLAMDEVVHNSNIAAVEKRQLSILLMMLNNNPQAPASEILDAWKNSIK